MVRDMTDSRPIPVFHESLWYLEEELTRPAYTLESAGITFPDERYCIHRPNGEHFFTFEAVLAGHGEIHLDGQVIHAGPGDAYILPPDTPVHYAAVPSDPWHKIWMNIGGALPEALVDSYQLRGQILFPGCRIQREFETMIARLRQPDAETPLAVALALHRICAALSAHRQGRTPASELAQRMKQHCEAHWREGFRLKELAALIHRSPVQALRIFRDAYGRTPGQWLQQRRLALAKQYLINTDCTLRALATLLGFQDEFYFANWFRRHAGISPGQFRRAQ